MASTASSGTRCLVSSIIFALPDVSCSLGPEDLTCGTLTTDENACIPTVVQNAYSQGLIPAEELGIAFAPITGSSGSDTNGVLTFGGADSSQYTGTLTYT